MNHLGHSYATYSNKIKDNQLNINFYLFNNYVGKILKYKNGYRDFIIKKEFDVFL